MPALLPLVAMFALYVGYGVSPGDALVYLGYEGLYILLPGWLTYRAIAGEPGSRLRQLVLGWALGYVVEIVFFLITGITATRSVLFLYPLVVAAATVPVVLRSRRPLVSGEGDAEEREDRPFITSRAADWGTAAIIALAVAYAGVSLFYLLPYPGHEAAYFPDYVYHLSLAAEAKHHWPITEPAAAGEAKPYHVFAHMHLASASTITGIDLPVVVFRLYILPLTALFAASVALLARSLTRRAWIGVVAVGIAVMLSEVDLDPQTFSFSQIPFFGLNFEDLILSPSYVLSEALLVPLALVLWELLRGRGSPRIRAGLWAIAALLAFGVSDAKVSALPVMLLAIAFLGAVQLWRQRAIPWRTVKVGALVVGVMLGLYLVAYAGAETPSDLRVRPFGFFGPGMPVVTVIRVYFEGLIGSFPLQSQIFDVIAAFAGAAGLLAAILAGLYWFFRIRGFSANLGQGWMLALFGAGLFLTEMTLGRGSPNNTYFLNHAWPFGAIVAAEGIDMAWRRGREDVLSRRGPLIAIALAWCVVFGFLIATPTWFDLFAGDGDQRPGHTYLFWYGGLILLVLGLYVLARLLTGKASRAPALLATGAVLLSCAVGIPLDYAWPQIENKAKGLPQHQPELAKLMTPDLYDGLVWIRGHTDDDAVLAVNNHWIDATNTQPLWTGYSAFSERRVYIENWYYTALALKGGKSYFDLTEGRANPYADRLALSDAAFRGDCDALHELAAKGVDYLVVDKRNGTVQPPPGAFSGIAERVYDNPGVAVYELDGARLRSPAACIQSRR